MELLQAGITIKVHNQGGICNNNLFRGQES